MCELRSSSRTLPAQNIRIKPGTSCDPIRLPYDMVHLFSPTYLCKTAPFAQFERKLPHQSADYANFKSVEIGTCTWNDSRKGCIIEEVSNTLKTSIPASRYDALTI